MTDGGHGGYGPTLDDGVRAAHRALSESAPMLGVIDLPPFDEMVTGRSMESRRATVYGRLGTVIPLLRRAEEVAAEVRLRKRKKAAWIISAGLFVLMVLTMAAGVDAAAGLFVMLWLGSLLLIWAVASSARPDSTEPITHLPRRTVPEHELKVVWVARCQVAAILQTRAWDSEDLRGSIAVVDLAQLLARITHRAMELYRFIATAIPEPTGAQPELVAQWRRERDRVARARTQLVEQLAGLVVYRNEMDRVSSLLDQRDQMGLLADRASTLDQISDPVGSTADRLDPSGKRRDIEHNLTAQIQFLGEMAARSPTAGPLSDAIHRE